MQFSRISWKYKLKADHSSPLLKCMAGDFGEISDKNRVICRVKGGCITFKAGFTWNGADYFPDFPCTQEAALVHDALCQLIAQGRSPSNSFTQQHRKCVDQQLYCMVRDKCSRLLASTMYNAIRGSQRYQRWGLPVKLLAGFFGGIWGVARGMFGNQKLSCRFQNCRKTHI